MSDTATSTDTSPDLTRRVEELERQTRTLAEAVHAGL